MQDWGILAFAIVSATCHQPALCLSLFIGSPFAYYTPCFYKVLGYLPLWFTVWKLKFYLLVFQRLKPTNPAAQKALTTPTHYKLTPRPATRVRPKALQSAGSAKSQLFDGLDDDEPSLSNGAFMPKLVFLSCMVEGASSTRITVVSLLFF